MVVLPHALCNLAVVAVTTHLRSFLVGKQNRSPSALARHETKLYLHGHPEASSLSWMDALPMMGHIANIFVDAAGFRSISLV